MAVSGGKDANLLNGHRQMRSDGWRCAALSLRAAADALRAVAVAVVLVATRPALAQIDLPLPSQSDPILITAAAANHWMQGSYEVWILRGNCRVRQGEASATGQEAVLWISRADFADHQPSKVIAYLEGDVALELPQGRTRLTDRNWLGRLSTHAAVEVRADAVAGRPTEMPPIYQRAVAQRDPSPSPVMRAQFTAPVAPATAAPPGRTPSPGLAGLMAGNAPGTEPAPPGTRRIRAFPRSDVPVQAQWFPDPATNQWIAVIDSGVVLFVDGLPGFGSIDVSTDRLVIWTTGVQEPDLSGGQHQAHDVPLQIYMEGNIVFRQGDRRIYADRMFYDVRNHVGTIINAEVLTPVPKFEGLVRLRAELVQQLGEGHFRAQNGYFTSSRFGQPTYRVQVGDVTFDDIQGSALDPLTGQPLVDPDCRPVIEHRRQAKGENAVVFVEEVPIFYWPVFATDLNQPEFYLRRVQFKQDNVFGMQIYTDWDLYQLLRIHHKPEGTDWDLSLDYLSQRGFGHGTTFAYNRPGPYGPYAGLFDFWGIYDNGQDNLGTQRDPLDPEQRYRYRLFWKHRQQLPEDFQLTAEVGAISDRNFLEEYFKREWDEMKDQTTGVELKQTRDNYSWSITADYRINEFFNETDWLPRLDHFWLGVPLLNDSLTWYEHSNVGYGRFHPARPPQPPDNEKLFTLLPWERGSAEGLRAATRQELDWPFQLGPVKLVPYAEGELAHWNQDLDRQAFDRAYGQAGLRASLPFWAVNPYVESDLWNVHGIAHKITLEADAFAAGTNRHLNEDNNQSNLAALPLYDPLDDNAIEAFRRRFAFFTFGNPNSVPPVANFPRTFDERFYALRTGLAEWVTSPSTEIADDLAAIRLGAHQRWQTKRGPPEQRRIVDWITLDTDITIFPDPDRDNFGRLVGLFDYDFHWFVGDRLTLVSDALMDFFPQGQKLFHFGGYLTRPPRGSLYLGMAVLEGPIHSEVLSASYSYWMSPKWVSSLGLSIDLGQTYTIGETLTITRVGESFLVSAGFSVDSTRGSVGANLAVEPRFLPRGRLGKVGGANIPVAGAYGLE